MRSLVRNVLLLLVAASFACGTSLGVGAPDAAVDHESAFDAGASDASTSFGDCACPDSGCFITVEGDGLPQTLRSNHESPVMYVTFPTVPFAQAYYHQGLVIGGSEAIEGGTSVRFDVEIHEDANETLSDFGDGAAYHYAYYTHQDAAALYAAAVTLSDAGAPDLVAGSYVLTSDASPSLSGAFVTCRLHDYSGPTPPHP
jgi:hypothetical protein